MNGKEIIENQLNLLKAQLDVPGICVGCLEHQIKELEIVLKDLNELEELRKKNTSKIVQKILSSIVMDINDAKINKKNKMKGNTHMKLSEFLKSNDIELTEEKEKQLKEIFGIKESKKWKPKETERYYYVNGIGLIESTTYLKYDEADEFRLSTNDYFKTIEEAEIRREQFIVYNELKNFADENNEEIDWNNKNQCKYYILYNYDPDILKFGVGVSTCTRQIGNIYFSHPDLVHAAIEKIGENRIKKYLFGVDNEEILPY